MNPGQQPHHQQRAGRQRSALDRGGRLRPLLGRADGPHGGLTAFGTTNSSTSLLWQPSVVPANCKVTSYSLFKNGTQVATTAGTSITVPQLAANTSYSFAVARVDPVGTSPKSTAVSVKTLAAPTGGTAQTVYAPYIDMALGQTRISLAVSKASGIKVFTLAFVLSSGGCAAGWQGVGSIAQDTLDNGTPMLSQVQALRAAGGDVIISFGGAAGQEPALTCPDAASLKAVYQQVVDRYQAKSLDFDIEGGAVADQASIARRNKALVALKAANPGLKISFTLPVLPTGLDSNGVGVLQSAKRDGLNPDVINIMTMDYGSSVDNGGRMGTDATAATSNTAVQIHQAGLTSTLGITPMIGQNDVAGEIFTLGRCADGSHLRQAERLCDPSRHVVGRPRQRQLCGRGLRLLHLQQRQPVGLSVLQDLPGVLRRLLEPLARLSLHRAAEALRDRLTATPIVPVLRGDRGIADDEQILGVAALGGGGEVEAAGDDHGPVDDHDLVVGDGDLAVDPDRYAAVGQIGRRAVMRARLADARRGLVDDHLDVDAAVMGGVQGRENRDRGEAIGLDQDLVPGGGDLPDDEIGAIAARRKADLQGGLFGRGCWGGRDRDEQGDQQGVKGFAQHSPPPAADRQNDG